VTAALQNNKISKLIRISLLVAAVPIMGLVTYKVVSSKGHIPPFPQPTFKSGEAEKSISDSMLRASSFHPTDDELKLVSMLEQLHLAETGEESEEPTMSVEKRTADLSAALAPAAKKDLTRFLALGDFLATRFDSALKDLLSQKPSTGENRSYALMRVTLFSGAFYTRALRSGLIAPDHTLNGSSALPEILFRYRWRRMGGLPGTVEFSNFEQKALLDFTVRFTDKQNIDRRLKAASDLAVLDKSYDAPIAKALILLDAGQKERAHKTLEQAIAAGRDDTVIDLFQRAVQQEL
jgi:hypothetical protein